jgi:hypothetical protein
VTRPSELKPREDEVVGAKYAEWDVGSSLPILEFSITPEIWTEYASVIDADAKGHVIDGRPAALPSVIAVYLFSVLYQKYPPQQGGIFADQKFNFHHPIWADETTHIRATGRIETKFEKRGRKHLVWSATFATDKGQKIASSVSTCIFPE